MNNPRVLAGALVATLGVVYFTPGNPFRTPAVKNVGEAWARGGGTETHTPAISTTRGSATKNDAPHEMKGVGTKYFDENFADQKSDPNSNSVHKQWKQAQYGNDKGK